MEVRQLDWYSKRFTLGDFDGSGSGKLLGKTELDQLEVAVRETAQNSWDARSLGVRPRFGIELRKTDHSLRTDLQAVLGGGQARQLSDLASALRRSDLRILEIWDRGTLGLDGPVDLSVAPKGTSDRFKKLIFKLGSTDGNSVGGGTYGFGKTACYAYSRVGTVVYWTRCRNAKGMLEHRFIVSAFGESYVEKGVEFTGRHWWGLVDGNDVGPLVGDLAAEYGSRFFARGFEGRETGTSILVLAPRLDESETYSETLAPEAALDQKLGVDDDALRFATRARSALRIHLWPKLIAEAPELPPPMSISLKVDGVDVPLTGSSQGVLGMWGICLNAIRMAQRGEPVHVRSSTGLPVNVHQIARRGEIIGHLAILERNLAAEAQLRFDDLDPAREDALVDRICLMRHSAELVVTTKAWVHGLTSEGGEWIAVFKPVEARDKTYASSEPPTHDDWFTNGSGSEAALIVRHTKNRVSQKIRDFLRPITEEASAASTVARTGNLSRRLGQLLPVAAPELGNRPSQRASGQRATRNNSGWDLHLHGSSLLGIDPKGRQQQRVEFTAEGPGADALVELRVSYIGEDGAHDLIDSSQLDLRWEGAKASGGGFGVAKSGLRGAVLFHGAPRRAFRIDMRAEGLDAEY